MAQPIITLTRTSPNQPWWNLPIPPCPTCAGSLDWFDCDQSLAFGCVVCADCGATFSIQVEEDISQNCDQGR